MGDLQKFKYIAATLSADVKMKGEVKEGCKAGEKSD